MINKFREFAARVAVLAADESGMSTVEYARVPLYTQELHGPPRTCSVSHDTDETPERHADYERSDHNMLYHFWMSDTRCSVWTSLR